MPPRKAKTDPRKAQALELVLAGHTFTEIAELLEVDRSTLWRWRQEPDFDEALLERQTQVRDEVHARLMERSLAASDVLKKVMDDVDAPAMAKVAAVKLHFELLGRHKGAPVQPAVQEDELETEEDAVELLGEYPEELLEQALKNKRRQREL